MDKLTPIDALAFGFPCNDYSVVGEQKGMDGVYGPLYSYGVKALKKFRPMWFLAENVGGLRNANDGKAFAKIMEELSKEYASGAGTAKYNGTVYSVDWFTYRSKIVSGSQSTITDISTGRTFKVKHQNGANGNHADVEPLTKADTEILCSLYGVATGSQLKSGNHYQRRAVVLTNSKGEQFVGSIYAIPHGKDTVSGNNFDGQFCIHFKGSTIHEGDGGSVKPSENHQAMITQGEKALKSIKDANGVQLIQVKDSYQ